jgi:hypothetical protein
MQDLFFSNVGQHRTNPNALVDYLNLLAAGCCDDLNLLAAGCCDGPLKDR